MWVVELSLGQSKPRPKSVTTRVSERSTRFVNTTPGRLPDDQQPSRHIRLEHWAGGQRQLICANRACPHLGKQRRQ